MAKKTRFLALLLIVVSVASVPASVVASLNANADSSDPIRVVPGSDINLVSVDSNLPVAIVNETDERMDLELGARATNAKLEVPARTQVSVGAQSAINAELPAKAVANGQVEVLVWINDSTGQRISGPETLVVNINRDVEGILLAVFIGLLSVLLVAGIVRTSLRSRPND
jgi:hypothetical protein